jgi:hypothetical protein
MTPKRIICQKPPFPKLIQKKPRAVQVISTDSNKENLPLDMMLPEDSLLIKPSETLKSLYSQSPVGDIHICLPYELGQNPKVKRVETVVERRQSLGTLNSSAHFSVQNTSKAVSFVKKTMALPRPPLENNCKINNVPFFDEEVQVNFEKSCGNEESLEFSQRNSEISIKGTEASESSPVKKEPARKYSKLPPKMIDTRKRRETPKVSRIEISVNNSYETPVNISQGSTYSASAARNNRVKLLSKDFKITRNTLTKYSKVSSLNSTPEPVEF